jgi:tetratricopeptide (TPR) repeat protein
MRATRISCLAILALLVFCFGVSARLDLWRQSWSGSSQKSKDVLTLLLGDSRRLFANHFFVKADSYFHSGYYPGIFDNHEAFQTPHIAADAGAMDSHNHGDEAGFLSPPQDWIEAFNRKFSPSVHTHLDEGGAQGDSEAGRELGGSSQVREILPWLRLSAMLDPNRVETYSVAAFWLRNRLGKVDEAEQFLREGLRENPRNCELLYELGQIYAENKNDPDRARNLWEAALRQWCAVEAPKTEPDKFIYAKLVSRLAVLEEKTGRYERALAYMRLWKACAPNPAAIQKQMDELAQAHPFSH